MRAILTRIRKDFADQKSVGFICFGRSAVFVPPVVRQVGRDVKTPAAGTAVIPKFRHIRWRRAVKEITNCRKIVVENRQPAESEPAFNIFMGKKIK